MDSENYMLMVCLEVLKHDSVTLIMMFKFVRKEFGCILGILFITFGTNS